MQECECGRSPETRAARTSPPDVELIESAVDGLAGSSAVFLNSRALGDALAGTVAAARAAGVTRLVALSAINADDDFSRQPSRARGDRNKEVDELAVASGLEWVSLRPSVFGTNFAGMWAPQIRGGDVVNGPFATASSAPIAESDIAAVAARAILTDDLLGQRIPTDRASVADQRPDGRDHRRRPRPRPSVSGGSTGAWCGSGSSAWASEPSSPTPTSPCWNRRSSSPRSSPTTSRRFCERPAQSFAQWVDANRRSFTN